MTVSGIPDFGPVAHVCAMPLFYRRFQAESGGVLL